MPVRARRRDFPKERIVKKAGVEIPFKPMEFDCLMLLVKYKNYCDQPRRAAAQSLGRGI